jgi:hypothetical protein
MILKRLEYALTMDSRQFFSWEYLPTHEVISRAYLRTINADAAVQGNQHIGYSGEAGPAGEEFRKVHETSEVGLRVFGRRPAVSTQDMLILAPAKISVSNVVAFIAGSKIPLMLRKADGEFTLIEQYCAHGYMGREFWDRFSDHDEPSVEDKDCLV